MNDVVAALLEHRAFVISGHRGPDGDSLGSALALKSGLEQIGKQALVVSPDAIPSAYRVLPGIETVRRVTDLPSGYPVAVLVECSSLERSGLDGYEGRLVLNIDHHSKNPLFGDVNWIDPGASAVGVMIYRVLQSLGVETTPDIASLIYVAILTDTGSFRFSNTNPEAFRVCAELLERGADPAFLATAMYDNMPAAKARLLGRALTSLEYESAGSVALMFLPYEAFLEYEGEPDTEGIVNHAQAIEGVDASLLFKEMAPGRFRISLRANESVDVAAVAAVFGGGGHPRAAGCTIEGDYATVRERILGEVDRRLPGGAESS
jgi:phosphoesterase RecJ-like protein